MAPDDIVALLATAPLLGLLDRDALGLIAARGDIRHLRAKDILFRAGERSDGGYVVLSGSLAVVREGADDLALAGPGSLVGRLALFLRASRVGSAVARERSSVLRISPTLMRRVLDEHPAAAARFHQALAADLSELTEGLDRVGRKLLSIKR